MQTQQCEGMMKLTGLNAQVYGDFYSVLEYMNEGGTVVSTVALTVRKVWVQIHGSATWVV